jgi:hypothetical protein
MPFVEDIMERRGIVVLKSTDLRDIALRNMWRGIMLAEQNMGAKIKYDKKIKILHQACLKNGEPVGEKAIERIVLGVKL